MGGSSVQRSKAVPFPRSCHRQFQDDFHPTNQLSDIWDEASLSLEHRGLSQAYSNAASVCVDAGNLSISPGPDPILDCPIVRSAHDDTYETSRV